MSFALITLVMSIAVALGLLVLCTFFRAGRLQDFFASFAAPRFVHPAGSGPRRVVFRREGTQEGWALIDRALRARQTVKFDTH